MHRIKLSLIFGLILIFTLNFAVAEDISDANIKNNYATESLENKNIENKNIENESIENESIENESIENESIENESIENESIENESIENESIENESIENKTLSNNELNTLIITGTANSNVNPLGNDKFSDLLIDGEEFENKSATLGNALSGQMGIHSNPFGGGASAPIIRGQEGVRIKVMQNDMDLVDMSQISPDHAMTADTLLADKVKVLRGVSTLLYSSSSAAGVVNIIDKRIPSRMPTDIYEGKVLLRYNANNKEKASILGITYAMGDNFAFRVESLQRDALNYEVPELKLSKVINYLPDSYNKSNVITMGGSFISDYGYLGASYNQRKDTYGLPGHNHKFDSCAAHIFDERQNSIIPRRYLVPYPHLMDDTDVVNFPHFHCGSDHELDPHHSHDHPFGMDGKDIDHNHKGPWVDLISKRFDIKGQLEYLIPGLEKISFNYSYTDYYHDEKDAGKTGDKFTPGAAEKAKKRFGEPNNFFVNKGHNFRLDIYQAEFYGLKGVLAFQYQQNFTSVHMPREREINLRWPLVENTNSRFNFVLFEQYSISDFVFELGTRIERQKIAINYDLDLLDRYVNPCKYLSYCPVMLERTQKPDLSPFQQNAYSTSASVNWKFYPDYALAFTYSHNERLPTPMELYFNGKHIATNSFEFGNKNLKKEISDNFELSFKYDATNLNYGFSIYYNHFNNYIYNQTLYRENNLFMRRYTQAKAHFYGFEAKLEANIGQSNKIAIFGDYVRGMLYDLPKIRKKYDTGETNIWGDPIIDVKYVAQADRNAPRVPPARIGLSWENEIIQNLKSKLEYTYTFTQKQVAPLEDRTAGYNMLNFGLNYKNYLDRVEYSLSFNINNILNAQIYNHSSFLPYVPQMGRNINFSIKLSF